MKYGTRMTVDLRAASSAFEGGDAERESARILRSLADRIEAGAYVPYVIEDINGTIVGAVTFAAVDRCTRCDGSVQWIDCPTGGWWAHDIHPDDNHDAQVARKKENDAQNSD